MIIYDLKLILPKKKFDHRKFLWRLLETLHDIHGFSCLGAVKKAIKIHQNAFFSHFTKKSNLFWVSGNRIQWERSPKIFTNRSGQAGGGGIPPIPPPSGQPDRFFPGFFL